MPKLRINVSELLYQLKAKQPTETVSMEEAQILIKEIERLQSVVRRVWAAVR